MTTQNTAWPSTVQMAFKLLISSSPAQNNVFYTYTLGFRLNKLWLEHSIYLLAHVPRCCAFGCSELSHILSHRVHDMSSSVACLPSIAKCRQHCHNFHIAMLHHCLLMDWQRHNLFCIPDDPQWPSNTAWRESQQLKSLCFIRRQTPRVVVIQGARPGNTWELDSQTFNVRFAVAIHTTGARSDTWTWSTLPRSRPTSSDIWCTHARNVNSLLLLQPEERTDVNTYIGYRDMLLTSCLLQEV